MNNLISKNSNVSRGLFGLLAAASFLGATPTATAQNYHTGGHGHGGGGIDVNRYEPTRIQPTRAPRIVQRRMVSRTPITEWRADPGYQYVDEKQPNRVPRGRYVTVGYSVTYAIVWDNGTTTYETERQ